eukprot:gene3005-5888_t
MFDIVFQSLQSSIKNMSTHETEAETDEFDMESNISRDCFKMINSSAIKSSSLRIQDLRNVRSIARRQISGSIRDDHLVLHNILTLHEEALTSGKLRFTLTERRLQHQVQSAERRLRELIFEITGEYGKSVLRLSRRKEFLRLSGRIYMTQKIWRLNWERFAMRLCYEINSENQSDKRNHFLNQLQSKHLCPNQDIVEINYIIDLLRKSCIPNYLQNLKVISILRFSASRDIQVQQGCVPQLQRHVITPMCSNQLQSIIRFISELKHWNSSKISRLKGQGLGQVTSSNRNRSIVSNTPHLIDEYLKSNDIEWLHPASYWPKYWDKIQKIHKNITKRKDSMSELLDSNLTSINTSSKSSLINNNNNIANNSHTTKNNNTIDSFDEFTERYTNQHSSFVCNPRLFYCLEERDVASSVVTAMSASSSSIREGPSNIISTGIGIGVGSRKSDNRNGLGSDVTSTSTSSNIHIKILDYLQKVYVKPNTHPRRASVESSSQSQHQHQPQSQSEQEELLSDIRSILSDNILRVVSYCGDHRDANGSDNGSRSWAGSSLSVDIIGSLPDVIKVRIDNTERYFHFAPASILNLLETTYLQSQSHTNEQMRSAAQLYPSQSLLFHARSIEYALLSSLYCMVRSVSVSSVSSESASASSKSVSIAASASSSDILTEMNMNMNGMLMPLPTVCMEELFRIYLWPSLPSSISSGSSSNINSANNNSDGDNDDEGENENDNNEDDESNQKLLPIASCLNLLPDHSRIRSRSQLNTSVPLRHSYAYLTADYDFSNKKKGNESDDVEDTDGISSPTSTNRSSTSKILSNVYFIQLWNDTNTNTNNNSNSNNIKNNDSIPQTIEESITSAVHNKDDQMLRAMLAAYAKGIGSDIRNVEDTNSSTSTSTSSANITKKKWDPAILSSVCRWRACLCESTDEPPPKYLCKYHSELKIFLDGRINSKIPTAESATYLPQKPPVISSSSPHRDLDLIRAASTLLQELWDGKLKSTVRSFARRVCSDMVIYRNISSMSEGRGVAVTTLPSWTKWKDKEALKREFLHQDDIQTKYQMIYNLEKLISTEFKYISDLNIFPSAELAIIRKEIKNFKEIAMNDNNAEFEIRLCEKKLAVIRARRQEEQSSRAVAQKKLMKAKALEEAQAKDPANFKNQRRF